MDIGPSREYLRQEFEAARAEYEKNPKELGSVIRYSKALWQTDDEANDGIAISLLETAYEETGVYRLKMYIGDFRIRRSSYKLRLLRDAVKKNPNCSDALTQLRQFMDKQLKYELEEFRERAEHLPADMRVVYEYGVRLFDSQRYDEAIAEFQRVQHDPKHRVNALFYLGRCLSFQNMKREAMEMLERAIREYELAETGDQKSIEMHYWLARSYEESGRAEDAAKIYAKITRWRSR